MRYHAHSLATIDPTCRVSLVGYLTTPLGSDVTDCEQIRRAPPAASSRVPRCRPVRLVPPPDVLARLPAIVSYPLKLCWIVLALTLTLLLRVGSGCDALLLQNPPALPALAVCRVFVERVCRGAMIVDWHNYSYRCALQACVVSAHLQRDESVVGGAEAEKVRPPLAGPSHRALRRSLGEGQCAALVRQSRHARRHWATLRHRVRFLCGHWRLSVCSAVVLYDRPPSWKFDCVRNFDVAERHELMQRLATEHMYGAFLDDSSQCNRFEHFAR